MGFKPTISDRLTRKQVTKLEAVLAEGARRGLMQRVERRIQDVLWRFDSVDDLVNVICYRESSRKPGHALVIQHLADLGPLVREGRWDELQAGIDALRARFRSGRQLGPLASLEVLRAREPEDPARSRRGSSPIELSSDQERVFAAIRRWARHPGERSLLTLGGYAGTGKSTLLGALAGELTERRIAWCAPTGKAALVLREKLLAAGQDPHTLRCSTIHRLIYRARLDPESGRCIGVERVRSLDCDLVVVDEASMLGSELLADLRSFGLPILAVGDHGQLPPIDDDLDLMRSPDLQLTEIHRQAADNPIIQLSIQARSGSKTLTGPTDDPRLRLVRVREEEDLAELLAELLPDRDAAWSSAILCWTNRMRVALNVLARQALGRRSMLDRDDLVICLRNAYFGEQLLANGSRGIVESLTDDPAEPWHWQARIHHPDDAYLIDGLVLRSQFGEERTLAAYDELPFAPQSWHEVGLLYDHGYALTVHKAQGSQFRRVILLPERPKAAGEEEWRHWLYTAVTRAEEELVIVDWV